MPKAPEPTQERRRNGLISFGADIRRLIAPVLGKNGFMHADILAHWDDILGGLSSKGVYPVRLVFPKGQRENAVLHVKAISGAYAMEFTANRTAILDRLNGFFGYRAVADVRVTQGALPVAKFSRVPKRPPVSEKKRDEVRRAVAGIQNDGLRAAAEELGCLLDEG